VYDPGLNIQAVGSARPERTFDMFRLNVMNQSGRTSINVIKN
jgi:hypothetical protein